MKKEPVAWITVNGKHIPIYEGESKADAVNRSIARYNENKKNREISAAKAQVDNRNLDIDKYAKQHNDVFLTGHLKKDFTPSEIKAMVDKIDEVYKEFGIDSDKLVYSLHSDPKLLDDMCATGSAHPNGVLSISPNSEYSRENEFSIIYHEMGHFLEYGILAKRGVLKKDFESSNFAKRLVYEAKNYLKKKYPNEKSYVSNYGLTSDRELLADAVKDYMMNKNNAKPMSKAVVRQLKKHIKQSGLGFKDKDLGDILQ